MVYVYLTKDVDEHKAGSLVSLKRRAADDLIRRGEAEEYDPKKDARAPYAPRLVTKG